ncbi:MAG: hypothetical protein WB723_06595 [Candidatus Acidiferrales bacterium]
MLRDSRLVAAEEYLKGLGIIIIELVLKGKRSGHYKAVVRAIDGHNATRNLFGCDVRKTQNLHASVRGNPSVLVEVTYLVEPPQRMSFVGCPSVIWLRKVDFANRLVGNSDETPPERTQFVFGQDRAIDNRERGVLWNAIQSSQTPNQLVEGRTHVVDHVTRDEADVRRDVQELKAQDVPSAFKVILAGNGIGIRGEIGYLGVESLKVSSRPKKFGIGIVYSRHGISI